MFKGLANLAQFMKQAHEAHAKFGELQSRLSNVTVEGSAGGGLVTVKVNGRQEVLACHIDESLLRPDDREVIEDLVVSATNEALRKLREATMSEFSQLSGSLDMESMQDLLGKLGNSQD